MKAGLESHAEVSISFWTIQLELSTFNRNLKTQFHSSRRQPNGNLESHTSVDEGVDEEGMLLVGLLQPG
jgi:hypothetical protein